MRTIFQVASFVLIGLGVPVAGFGLLMLIYSWLTPPQPPPSLNEGLGLAHFIGWGLFAMGSVSVMIGGAVVSALRANPAPGDTGNVDWRRRHRRLW